MKHRNPCDSVVYCDFMDLFITVAESSSEKGRFVPVAEGQLDTLETLVARCRKKFYALEPLSFQVAERL